MQCLDSKLYDPFKIQKKLLNDNEKILNDDNINNSSFGKNNDSNNINSDLGASSLLEMKLANRHEHFHKASGGFKPIAFNKKQHHIKYGHFT